MIQMTNMIFQIGMFAYTGLKPEQMDTLAKEVRFIPAYFL